MKPINLQTAALAGFAMLCLFVAPVSAQQTDTGTGTPSGTPTGPATTMGVGQAATTGMPSGTADADKTFVANAAEGSMTEIQASRIALMKSNMPEVRMYAQKMIDDHTKLIADMKPFADQMGVTPPTRLKPEHQREAVRLKAMTGDNFDKEYIKAMVANHHKDVVDLQTEVNTTHNADLKATVAQGLQVVKMHTEMIDTIAQKNNIPTPPTTSAL